jgi:Asp-tRNA(Asn)/Glu-tRNA(Gln) amidotransferase C subunit
MEKLMTLDILSSIEGAEASEAVSSLFAIVKEAGGDIARGATGAAAAQLSSLRPDEARQCPIEVRERILANFPRAKNRCLVVPKVIED